VRESPQDFFLSAKARFQKSEDIEDAAELFFASRNLIHHGVEFEWDDTLQKMDVLLKEKGVKQDLREEAEAAEETKKPDPKFKLVGEEPQDDEKDAWRSRLMRVRDDRGEQQKGVTLYRERDKPSWLADTSPTRDTISTSIIDCIERSKWAGAVPPSYLRDIVENIEQELRDTGVFRLGTESEDVDELLRLLLSGHARAVRAPRIRKTGRELKEEDEHEWLNMFPEHCETAEEETSFLWHLYESEMSIYKPSFVRKTEPLHMAHEDAIRETALGGMTEAEMRAHSPEAWEHYQVELGRAGEDVLGRIVEHGMSRLYERGFRQWEEWYQETFPDGPHSGEGRAEGQARREIFWQHKFLRDSGAPEPYIMEKFYNEDGSLSGTDPRDIVESPEFQGVRNRDQAISEEVLEHGLHFLDSDPRKPNNEERLIAYKAYFRKVDDETYRLQDPDYVPEESEERFFEDGDSNLRPRERHHHVQGKGFTAEELYRMQQRRLNIMNRAIQMAWTAPPDISNHHRQVQILPTRANYGTYTMSRCISNFISKDLPEDFTSVCSKCKKIGGGHVEGCRGGKTIYIRRDPKGTSKAAEAGADTIRNKLFDTYRENWDFEAGLPKGDYSSIHKRIEALQEWARRGVLTPTEVRRAEVWLGADHLGHGDNSAAFYDRRDDYKFKSAPELYILEPQLAPDHDSTIGANPKEGLYGYILGWFQRNGGLGMTENDAQNTLLARRTHKGRPIRNTANEIADQEELPQFTIPPAPNVDVTSRKYRNWLALREKVKANRSMDNLTALFGNVLAPEISRLLEQGSTLEAIRDDKRGLYPELQKLLLNYARMIKHDADSPELSEEQMKEQTLQESANTDHVKEVSTSLDVPGFLRMAQLYHAAMMQAFPGEITPYTSIPTDEAGRPLWSESEGGWLRHGRLGDTSSAPLGRIPHSPPLSLANLAYMNPNRIIRLLHDLPLNMQMDGDFRARERAKLPRRHQFPEGSDGTDQHLHALDVYLKNYRLARHFSLTSGIGSDTVPIGNVETLFPGETTMHITARHLVGTPSARLSRGTSDVDSRNKTRDSSFARGFQHIERSPTSRLRTRDVQAKIHAMLLGLGEAPPLRFPANKGAYAGKPVWEHPEVFDQMLRSIKGGFPLPKEWKSFKSPVFSTDAREVWQTILGREKGGEAEMPWVDRVDLKPHSYPVLFENGKYYLQLQQMEHSNVYVPDYTKGDDARPIEQGLEKIRQNMLKNVNGQPITDFSNLINPLKPAGGMEGYRYRDLHADDDQTDSEGRTKSEVRARQLTSSPMLEIPTACVFQQEDGTLAMLGPHPSRLAADFTDLVLSKLPHTPDLTSASHLFLNGAKDRAEKDYPQGDMGDANETRDAKNHNLTLESLSFMNKQVHELMSKLPTAFGIMAWFHGLGDAERKPDEYLGDDGLPLGPAEAVQRYVENKLTLNNRHYEAGSKHVVDKSPSETDAVRSRQQMLINHAVKYINNPTSSYEGGFRRRVRNYLEERMPEIETALDNSDRILSETELEYPHRTLFGPIEPEENILRELVSAKKLQGNFTGLEFLTHVLENEPRVEKILESFGMTPEEAVEKITGNNVMGLFGEPEVDPTQSYASCVKDIVAATHYAKGTKSDPLHWHGVALSEEEASRQAMEARDAKGRRGNKLILAQRRAARARQSQSLKGHLLSLRDSDPQTFQDTLQFLFQRGSDGISIWNILSSLIATSKTKFGKPAFPEAHHILTDEDRGGIDRLSSFLTSESRSLPLGHTYDYDSGQHSKRKIGYSEGVPYRHMKMPGVFQDGSLLRLLGGKGGVSIHPSWGGGDEEWQEITGEGKMGDTVRSPKEREISFMRLHPDTINHIGSASVVDGAQLDYREEGNPQDIDPNTADMDTIKSLDVLTDIDLLYKGDDSNKGRPIPVKAMHRIFTVGDLSHLRGFSEDWVVSSWASGERVIIDKKKTRLTCYNQAHDSVILPKKVQEGIRAAHKANFIVDAIWDGENVFFVDIVHCGDEKMENMPTKDRIRHLRAEFSATEEVSIPAPFNTKRVDSEGLERAVKDLLKEKGVKQVMLRDAESTYMRGESRHPKWVMLTPQKQLDVRIVDSENDKHLMGIGPLMDDDASSLGNRAASYDGDYYMDVGYITRKGLEKGDYITVRTPKVTSLNRGGFKVYKLTGARYVKDAESAGTDSIETLEILSGEHNMNVPHHVRIKKTAIHLEFPHGHVIYDTEVHGHGFIVKSVDSPSDYLRQLAETQEEYWHPLAAVLLRADIEAKKSRKAAVVPEPPANHEEVKPKKVLKPKERILKDPVLTKQVVTALEMVEGLLKEKITFTGPKGLGIDFATPVESPSGPTTLTEPKNLPDHDPGHRQEKDGVCWCGAQIGQECEQGLATKMEDCPKFSPPPQERDDKHVKIPISG